MVSQVFCVYKRGLGLTGLLLLQPQRGWLPAHCARDAVRVSKRLAVLSRDVDILLPRSNQFL